ncbi:hypothetical protein [Burkholderia vietnamiensis]|uniref:hypothetical protein n=1 Tax=Burkholderia vietnamiensis TaxID=60552 RepID=UPI001CF455A8|nr:hypothetical protein [Burkholderia vietnamiensis]MCA8287593.1 hypothetical protein [Burkholderia vietnamiensis]
MTQQTTSSAFPSDRPVPMVDVKPLIEQSCTRVPAWVAQVLVPHGTFEECGHQVDRNLPIASPGYAEALWWSLLLRILRDGSGRIVVRMPIDDMDSIDGWDPLIAD